MLPAADPAAAMREPGFYPHRPQSVEVRETHISLVFLAGDLVYKLKKPVVFSFVDYSTLERRRHFCHEELRLNRRMSSDVYLGVRAIVDRDGRLELADEDAAGAVEYAVEMRRLPDEATLACRLGAHQVGLAEIEAVGVRLAEFHAHAEHAGPPAGDPETVKRTLDDNFETLTRLGARGANARALQAVERFSDAWLAGHRALLDERRAAGSIRDCHGDLRTDHVVLERGEVQVIDCVEFNAGLRQIDVSSDLAFLAMDLESRGEPALSTALVDAYGGAGGDPGPDSLLWFYAAYRACVRAKVAALRGEQGADGAEELGRLLDLARRLAWRARLPLVLVLCGVSGSGKTRLAEEVRAVSGLPHLNSDVVRKELAGIPPTQRAAPEAYSEEPSLATYRRLGELAGARTGAVVDATCRRARERRAFLDGLSGSGPVVFAECHAPLAVLLERVRDRARGPSVSDADPELVSRQVAEWEALDEVPPELHLTLRSDRPPESLVGDVEAFLDARLAAGALEP